MKTLVEKINEALLNEAVKIDSESSNNFDDFC